MIISSIILIGPIRTGKTTLARQLAVDLGLPRQSLDDLRWQYYQEIGFDMKYSKELEERGEWNQRRLYWSKHDPHAIKRILKDYGQDHVIDFGGSHSLHEDDQQLAQVQQLLADYANVVLVLPTPDPVESLRVLDERREGKHLMYGFDLNERMLNHKSNHVLAKHKIYTHGKSIEETTRELIEQLGLEHLASYK